MRCYDKKDGMDPSLLFFFLILVMIFCRPGIVGCGNAANRHVSRRVTANSFSC